MKYIATCIFPAMLVCNKMEIVYGAFRNLVFLLLKNNLLKNNLKPSKQITLSSLFYMQIYYFLFDVHTGVHSYTWQPIFQAYL